MTIINLYHNLFFILIISTVYSAQGLYGFRISDILVYMIVLLGFFISYKRRDAVLWLIAFIFLLLALANDFFYFATQVDYSSSLADSEGNIPYDRFLLYLKYITFLSLPLSMTAFQNNQTYSSKNLIQKNKIKYALILAYFLFIIFLAQQYLLLYPERLSFPFSNADILWPKKTDAHVLGITMAFLIAFMQVMISKKTSIFQFAINLPGIIIMLLTGSSGGVLILLSFYLLYLKPKELFKYFLIILIIFSLFYVTSIIDPLLGYIADSPMKRALSIPRLIYENVLTDDINRFTIHQFIISELIESNRFISGFGFLGMPFFYYDSFIASLLAPLGIIGLFLFITFLYLVYKNNTPYNIEQRRLYRIFVFLFIISIFISEYHLVVRSYVLMIACVYYFSNGQDSLNKVSSSLSTK